MKAISVIGAGAWGTALAKVLADKGGDVLLWSRREDHAKDVREARENRRYLPGIALPPNLRVTASLEEALRGREIVVLVVPSHALRGVLVSAKPFVEESAVLVSATKGIENDTLMLMGEVVEDVLGPKAAARLTVLSGPSFAKEVALGLPTNIVVAAHDHALSTEIQHAFATDRLRVYSSDDPAGVEVGGALKNVVAIAAGACDGLGFGHNTRAALITRGLAEIARLAMARGGSPLTLAGLAGMGDLVLTCTGELSRNRTVGVELGRGRKLGEVLASLGHVAEGVKTAKSAYDLSLKLSVDMPIMREVYAVLYDDKPLEKAVADLMARELGPEF
jgi:glycerol-3-phosphate dehydrogenase (NAD(P)+)